MKLELSPTPTHSEPSAGSTRTVPIECDAPLDGMQSSVFEAAGQAELVYEPSSTVSWEVVFDGLTVTRRSCPTICPLESGVSGATSYV